MDAHKNFAVSAVATAPSPATSGTSLVVTAAQGTRFPAVPFNATIWPTGEQPDPSNAEIVRVTAIATDTLTIARAEEGSSARTVVVGDQIAATITAKTLTDVESLDGWIDDTNATWTRTADQTFTVTGDRTAVFQKGTRLRWTQTTVKYGVVLGSSHAAGTTTVTIATNTDYVLTAAAISVNGYSYAASPQGYPAYFNFAVSWTGSGSNPAIGNGTIEGKFCIIGTMVQAWAKITIGSTTTFGSGNYSVTLPIPKHASLDALAGSCISQFVDQSGGFTLEGKWRFDGILITFTVSGATIRQAIVTPTAPVTWQTTDVFELHTIYEAA